MIEANVEDRGRVARADAPALDASKLAILGASGRVWAIGAVRGDADRLASLHDALSSRFSPGDRVVYLGDYLGVGASVREVVDELLRFRCGFLMQSPLAFTADIVHLRGSQEEMWRKVLQLQFAAEPTDVLDWMVARGVEPTIRAYGGRVEEARLSIKENLVAVARWTGRLRASIRATPGHTEFQASLKRAAVTGGRAAVDGDGAGSPSSSPALLFVNAGIDPKRDLDGQGDRFWWGGSAFEAIDKPFGRFARVVRGADPRRAGFVEKELTVSLDGGSGHGGSLLAACFDEQGEIVDRLEV